MVDRTRMGYRTTGMGNRATDMGNGTTRVSNGTTSMGNRATGMGNGTTRMSNDSSMCIATRVSIATRGDNVTAHTKRGTTSDLGSKVVSFGCCYPGLIDRDHSAIREVVKPEEALGSREGEIEGENQILHTVPHCVLVLRLPC